MMSTTQSIYEDAAFGFTPLCDAIRRKRCEFATPRKVSGRAQVSNAYVVCVAVSEWRAVESRVALCRAPQA